jgi:hypothetical protein
MKSLLAGGATAVLLLVGAVTATPALADTDPSIQVTSIQTASGTGDIAVTGTYLCDSPAVPGISITVTQTGVTQSEQITQRTCDGSSRSFNVPIGGDFVAGDATYTADLVDAGNSDAPLASDPNNGVTTTITTPPPPPPDPGPGVVRALTATKLTTSSITISWSPPSQPGAAPDVYTVSVAAPKASPSSFTGASPFTFTGLQPGTTYTVSVKATDNQGMVGLPQTITPSTTALPKPKPKPKPKPSHPSRVRLHVTIHTTHHNVRPTHLDVILGQVSPHHRVQVELQRRVQGVWVVANSGSRRASASGRYHFEIRPVAKFVCRVVILSTKKFKASHSKTVVVHIKH